MKQKPAERPASSERIIRDIKRKTRKQYSAEDKIRIVLDGLRGEDSIVEPCRREGYTGVWVGAQKIASIGIACRGWVTYHGFALNLDVDPSRFRLFRPCDLDPRVMTSLTQLGAEPDIEDLKESIWKELSKSLGRRPAP